MNEPDELAEESSPESKATRKDALRSATLARARETRNKFESRDQENAFHWVHFQNSR